MSKIQYINVEKIVPHPDNPRRELGDLTELAASIKESGIFQNLTVIPFEDKYRVVIGHRRLAASKLAGLETVPCIVSDMDYATQCATMLLENMQRSDLTVREQAEGFQMMLDLGHTAEEISDKTGLSKSTVSRRLSLLQFDRDKFNQAADRGATLSDFAELDKVKDPELKNKVLDAIGTNNFKYELNQAIQKEKEDERIKKWKAYLDSFATEVKNTSDYDLVKYLYVRTENPPEEIPKDADTVKYYYHIGKYDSCLLKEHTEKVKTSEQIERERKEQERQSRYIQLDKVAIAAKELRHEFVKNYTGKNEHIKVIFEFFTEHIMFYANWVDVDEEEMAELCSVTLPEDDEDWENTLVEELNRLKPGKVLLAYILLCKFDDNYGTKTFDYYNHYCRKEHLEKFYALLVELGYQMSDEEKKMLDGTHELYVKENENEKTD